MLMKTPYKTAAELGQTPEQYEGLLRTLAYLRRIRTRRVLFKDRFKDRSIFRIIGTKLSFCMHFWNHHPGDIYTKCGTVSCMGGTAERLVGHPLWGDHGMGTEGELKRLFFPDHYHPAYQATPQQSADALENYLVTGMAQWELFVEEDDCTCCSCILRRNVSSVEVLEARRRKRYGQ